ncbi:hypothetical protein [Streptomyces sp. TLI_171]|uniref:hypothetical protein n=1 Tax=Streptomyces sp. TLI_171 TaxID=1938859 RepID=UPI000C560952|nr:hypothetical protein [Streptomyces sp. TLI_171]RKE19520.1 hypothetical protein BX266_2843 [Streptomyces sp. TLI_171]
MASTTPRPDDRPEPTVRGEAQPAVVAPVPMRVLLASCRAARAVSTPPERRAA